MGATGFSNYRPVQCERCKNRLGLYFVQVEPNSPRLYCFIWEVQKSDLQFQPLFYIYSSPVRVKVIGTGYWHRKGDSRPAGMLGKVKFS